MMKHQKTFRLRWRLFLWGSSDILTGIVAHNGGQYFNYGQLGVHSPLTIHNARQKIVDARLTLIFMMGQGASRLHFNLSRWLILPFWMDVTIPFFDCWMGKTVNRSHSVDANLRTHLKAHLRDILTIIGCSTFVHKMHTVFIGSWKTVSMYYHLHPKPSRPLSFWATTIHIIWAMNACGPLCFSVFGRQLTA